jgi:hypothetical protein
VNFSVYGKFTFYGPRTTMVESWAHGQPWLNTTQAPRVYMEPQFLQAVFIFKPPQSEQQSLVKQNRPKLMKSWAYTEFITPSNKTNVYQLFYEILKVEKTKTLTSKCMPSTNTNTDRKNVRQVKLVSSSRNCRMQ